MGIVITVAVVGLIAAVLWSLGGLVNRGADASGVPRWVAWLLVVLGLTR